MVGTVVFAVRVVQKGKLNKNPHGEKNNATPVLPLARKRARSNRPIVRVSLEIWPKMDAKTHQASDGAQPVESLGAIVAGWG